MGTIVVRVMPLLPGLIMNKYSFAQSERENYHWVSM